VGEAPNGTDTRRYEPASRPLGYPPYGERKPYVVADTLATLSGPTHGVVTLPHHLEWSSDAEYDLSEPVRMADMYKVVLIEAATVDDLRACLSGDLLLRFWLTLWLPRQLRQRWEERFPDLAATRTDAA
jgi:hypothetical protein